MIVSNSNHFFILSPVCIFDIIHGSPKKQNSPFLTFSPRRYIGRKKKSTYSGVVMVQATNLASEKDVKIHIQRGANGAGAGQYLTIRNSLS